MLLCKALGICLLATILQVRAGSLRPEDFETVRNSNAALLNRLGLLAVDAPDGHHRKRLAGPHPTVSKDHGSGSPRYQHQSSYGRRHIDERTSPHDSHVYVVKLPAGPPYYSFVKPHKKLDGKSEPNVTVANPNVGFKNNGKPAKIYHWNLPVVKKIIEKKKLHEQQLLMKKKKLESERNQEKMNIFQKLAEQNLVYANQNDKPLRNNDKWLSYPEHVERVQVMKLNNMTQLKVISSPVLTNKAYRLNDNEIPMSRSSSSAFHHPSHHRFYQDTLGNNVVSRSPNNILVGRIDSALKQKKHRKKAAMSYYYAPSFTGKANSMNLNKIFPGNGKPKAFYVMEKSRKPAYYHPLLP